MRMAQQKCGERAHEGMAGALKSGILAAAIGCSLASAAHAQMGPQESIKTFKVADGLECSLFASEPMFYNPTNIDIDATGRVWVCEGVNYRSHNKLRPEGDRIMILEDMDGDGKADKSTVFYQGTDINAALGICVLGNKVIVSCSPNVFILTDTDGDGKADKKEVFYTGVSGVQHDHGMHAFVFGPDGKLYFNFGNEGKQISRSDAQPVRDVDGNTVTTNGRSNTGPKSKSGPYRQGLVFRCNPDGSNFEVLGSNFRNNYEVNVDSFGTMWQSDNDDDGNRGVRINYVMEHGNFGYTDELSGAGWGQKRTNMESEIPLRHWHLNDPGVVPNLLQTGAGSPTGILVYEGNLLPEVFRGQLIHADAGPNVVRAYVTTPDGAGYKAQIVNIIEGGDKWFRPSDVCVAPDGSLFVADWYDPGVGGHAMGDNKWGSIRGRIFRLAPPGTKYGVPKLDLQSAAGAVQALSSPNLARRYLAWNALHEMGQQAEGELQKLWASDNQRLRARALNLLARIDGRAEHYVTLAIKDANSDIRITGLRIARELKLEMIPLVKSLLHDPSPQVRRECALALRHNQSTDAAELWAELAMQHDGKDRWYLEALGIGAERNEDEFLSAWLKRVGDNWNTPAGRDIIWRSRGTQVPAILARIIADPATPARDCPRYLRAFDFLSGPEKDQALALLLQVNQPGKGMVVAEALTRLKGTANIPNIQQIVDRVLDSAKGTPGFIDLVDQLGVKNRDSDVLAEVVAHPTEQTGASGIRVLVKNGNSELIRKALAGKDAEKVAMALGSVQDSTVVSMLVHTLEDGKQDLQVRRAAATALGRTRPGSKALVERVKQNALPADLLPVVASSLHTSTFRDIRDQAKILLPLPPTKDGKPLPEVSQLRELKGDPANGALVFKNICLQCHQVSGQGTNFGPGLTEIGDKLGKDGLYTAILYPSAGIEHSYEGHVIRIKGGDDLVGILQSETADEIQLRIAGGIVTPIRKKDIVMHRIQKESIMPDDLQKGMTVQELVDLVEYLTTLRKIR